MKFPSSRLARVGDMSRIQLVCAFVTVGAIYSGRTCYAARVHIDSAQGVSTRPEGEDATCTVYRSTHVVGTVCVLHSEYPGGSRAPSVPRYHPGVLILARVHFHCVREMCSQLRPRPCNVDHDADQTRGAERRPAEGHFERDDARLGHTGFVGRGSNVQRDTSVGKYVDSRECEADREDAR